MIRNDLWLECSLYVWKTRHKVGVEATKSRPGYLSSVLVMSSLLFAGGELGACWQVKSSVSCNNCNIKDCSRLARDTPVWSAVNRKYLYWFFVISVLAVFFVNYITGLPPIDQLITTGGAQDWATLMERNDELFIVMLYNYLPWPEDKCDLPMPSLLAACWFLLISWWGDWGTFLPSSPTQLQQTCRVPLAMRVTVVQERLVVRQETMSRGNAMWSRVTGCGVTVLAGWSVCCAACTDW